ncbi:hypothetical protein GWI33_018654 [Rhynchophorus ferrugineus]|uniref:Uncharacterized protein n=1 Tax=Rhynchophorus ferrugineus TaxID=354439 RepID=A0A834HWI8_RHYFE|nr:hypothetical protein GWI33_018654 [Rhynchophorus ferrugineus]
MGNGSLRPVNVVVAGHSFRTGGCYRRTGRVSAIDSGQPEGGRVMNCEAVIIYQRQVDEAARLLPFTSSAGGFS